MALFFDQRWFDARLESLGLTRNDAAGALGLTRAETDEVWKDQRELSAAQVATLAALLAVPAAEIADRAGVSTPVPHAVEAAGDGLSDRVARLERRIADLEQMLLSLLQRR